MLKAYTQYGCGTRIIVFAENEQQARSIMKEYDAVGDYDPDVPLFCEDIKLGGFLQDIS